MGFVAVRWVGDREEEEEEAHCGEEEEKGLPLYYSSTTVFLTKGVLCYCYIGMLNELKNELCHVTRVR